jgi:hypothetical protein
MATSKLVEKTTEEEVKPTQVVVEPTPVVEEKKEEQEVVQYPGNPTRGFRQ